MNPDKYIAAPMPTTPSSVTTGGRRSRALPLDLLEQTCRRVGIAGLAFAGLWGFALLMNNVVYRWMLDTTPDFRAWPWPGNLFAGIGVVMSLGMLLAAGRLHTKPDLLINVGLAFEVATAFLIGLMNQWAPGLMYAHGGVSWICVVILVYPAIAPATLGRTLTASLLAASMDPLGYAAGVLRGVEYGSTPYELLWAFLPNYVCAFLAVVPVHIILGLGRQVTKARELGSYRLGEELDTGGMGAVHRASHRMLAKPAAIKLIRPEVLGASSPEGARVIVERFRREAEAAATLRSPHTIELYDFGVTDDGVFYYVMELLEGVNLDQLVKRFGPVPAERTIHLLKQACHSLAEAHHKGLIHRDIKPSNIVTSRMGLIFDFVKVLDFGLVKADPRAGREQTALTSPDITTGTPAFMAPEIAMGKSSVDRRADIYALGCVAYWLLTGQFVFDASNSVAMLMQHIQEAPVRPSYRSELRIPAELEELIMACLAKDPDDRPADAEELYRRFSEVPLESAWSAERAREWWQLHLSDLCGEPECPEAPVEEEAEAAVPDTA